MVEKAEDEDEAVYKARKELGCPLLIISICLLLVVGSFDVDRPQSGQGPGAGQGLPSSHQQWGGGLPIRLPHPHSRSRRKTAVLATRLLIMIY